MSSTSLPLSLVTGASGYLGTQAVVAFVDAGFRVRGTVRRASHEQEFAARLPEYASKVEFVVVEDITQDGAFDAAVKGVEVVAHVASPVTFNPTDNEKDVLIPAIHGTTSILKSAAKESSIKSVVIVSSIVAHVNFADVRKPGYVLSSTTWNEASYEEAAKPETEGRDVYRASKTLAEKAAWDFIEKEKPSFSFATVAPTWILGASLDPTLKSLKSARSSFGTTIPLVLTEKPEPNFNLNTLVHVKDVATALVKAVTVPAAFNKRHLLIGDRFSPLRAAYVLRQKFPEHADRIGKVTEEEAQFAPTFQYDGASAARDLGFEYHNFDDTIIDWGKQVLSLPSTE